MTNNKYIFRFSNDKEIFSPLAFAFLLVFSFAVAWYCLRIADEVVSGFEASPVLNIKVENNLK
jgi:hypothetical protein